MHRYSRSDRLIEELAMDEPMVVTEIVERVPDRFKGVLEEAGEGARFIRKTLTVVDKGWDFDEGERAEVGYVSTAGIDRDAEILLPSGCDLRQFRKAPQVLWGHDYDLPPIGKAIWVKPDQKKSPRGILAKTVYAKTDRAEEIWQLVKGGFLKTFSVGFIPTKSTYQGAEDWDKVCDQLKTQGYDFDRTKVRRIYTKWILLEYSKVSVPANIDALTVAVAKGNLKLSQETCKQLQIEQEVEKVQEELNKAVIPYQDLGAAPETADWDAGKETREATVEDLKLMSTWYDRENEDIKTAYKLPHHRAAGLHAAVWRGVAAAMGALLGARGGVDIPSGDRRGVYNHLKKHYAAWDKEAPEFRNYVEAELKILFDESWQDILWLNYPALKPYPNEHSCRLLSPDGWDRVRRQNDKFGQGIHAIYGIKDDKAQLQAIRFDKSKFTVAAARKWCRDHDHECILFEPATDTREAELAMLEATVEHIAQPDQVEKIAIPEKPDTVELVDQVESKKQTAVEFIEKVEQPSIVEMVEREIGRQLGKV
jgi:phage head maturation protease